MKIIPHVEFKIADINSKIKEIIFFLNDEFIWDWKDKIFNEYPDLKKRLENIKEKSEKEKIIKKFFLHYQKVNKGKIIKAQKNFQQTWDSINEKFMLSLSKILEISWSEEHEKLYANVSISPISPRYLELKEFDIYYKENTKGMKDNLFHELLHFLYFEKWKKIFPKTPKEHFEYPHLEWQMSEMVVKAILNDPKIQKIYSFKPKIYKEYEKVFIGENFLLNHIDKFYKEKTSFEDFLIKAWTFIQKNEEKIKKQLK